MTKPVTLLDKSAINAERKFKHFITPMLAKLHDQAFDSKDWVYEIKWDGYRAIAEINKKGNRLYSRNGLSFEEKYPEIFDALNSIKKDVVLDGEIVAFDENGMPSFQLLQQYGEVNVPLIYYVFDCLYLNGKSLEDKPLVERKEALRKLLPESDLIKYCDHVAGTGIAFFEAAKKQHLEGIIAKRADSKYYEGTRTADWLKIKNVFTEEAIIAGYTEPRGGRKYFGALILAQYNNGKLEYIGHTGTGFNFQSLKDTYAKLQGLETDKSPFDKKIKVNSPVHWVKPELVCNLKYSEITSDGSRRHPVFMGLRIDKKAKEVKAGEELQTTKGTGLTKATTKKTVAK
ncbi:MAG: non-homologous end-joining DNA ligase, partial [Bacteroidetes bacterium]|nr:non-homologous end-joining DNA ligase [Bacteroidota bacterium]